MCSIRCSSSTVTSSSAAASSSQLRLFASHCWMNIGSSHICSTSFSKVIEKSIGSAIKRRVISASVCFEVEVTDCSTIGDVAVHIIYHVSLGAGGERSHLSLSTFVPDDTLDKTLASADRIEVDLCGGGVETHVLPLTTSIEYIIQGAVGRLVDSSTTGCKWHWR